MDATTRNAVGRSMSALDRMIEALIESDAPLQREELHAEAHRLAPALAPLADPSVVHAAVDAVVGLGPLQALVDDPAVSDVLVNAFDDVWVERGGRLVPTDAVFPDDAAVLATVRRLIAPLGLRIDRAQPALDARLADGSRLHVAVPPASVDGTIVAIRRFHPAVATLDDLVERGSSTPSEAERLQRAVEERSNVLVAGATGAGKTTLLNVLGAAIPPHERTVTIEDAAELSLSGHVVRLESRLAHVDGVTDVTMRSLVRHALRLRPDRLIVGEVRGPEALDMIQAMTTGHAGSMSTVHARNPFAALVRVESLAAMAPEGVPDHALRNLVEGAFDLVVMVERHRGGRRVAGIHRIDEVLA